MEITREDLDMIDKIFANLHIDQEDNVDIGQLKKDLAKSEDCSEEKKLVLLSILDNVDGDLHWTNFLDVIKVGMANQGKPEQGRGILKKRLSEKTQTPPKRKGVHWAPQMVEEREIVKEEFDTGDTVNVPLTWNQRRGLLRMFNRMDPNGDGFVTDVEFRAYMMEHRTGLASSKILELFHQIRESSQMKSQELEERGITFMDLVVYFRDNSNNLQLPTTAVMRMMGETGGKRAWEGLGQRPPEQSTMNRQGPVKEFLPGVYYFNMIVDYSDLPTLRPASTVVEGVRWEAPGEEGEGGKIVFPDSFSREIQSEVATMETLSYYGARFVGGDSNCNVTFQMTNRQRMDDMTYSDDFFSKWVNRSGRGPTLEWIDSPNLDCPLSSMGDSGHFVLARWTGDEKTEIEMTAFKVPPRRTIYTPAGTMHTRNYLRGTWRSLLSAEAPVNEAKLEVQHGEPCGLIILTEADQVQEEQEEQEKEDSRRKGVRGGIASVITRFEKLFGFS